MPIPYWMCLECGKIFKPKINKLNSFNCPKCNSEKTIRTRRTQVSGYVDIPNR